MSEGEEPSWVVPGAVPPQSPPVPPPDPMGPPRTEEVAVGTRRGPGGAPPGDQMSAQPTGPSRLWYWVAGAAVVIATAWLGLGAWSVARSATTYTKELQGRVGEFQRVPIPGQGEMMFAEPGGYTLFYEGSINDELVPTTVPSFTVSLAPVGGGQDVAIRPYEGSYRYSAAGHSGRAIGTFRIEQPGTFVLRADGAPGDAEAGVAVGQGVALHLDRALLRTTPGAVLFLLAGAVLAVVVAVRRHRARPRSLAPALQTAVSSYGAAAAAGPVAGGWFADPSGRHQFRYWDGEQWTAHVSDGGSKQATPCDPRAQSNAT